MTAHTDDPSIKPLGDQHGHLMTIGAFSRLSRLSLKALRLYDALGLLLPTQVDQASGYRFYTAVQLERARSIGLLRQLELPLPQIQMLLDAPPAGRAVLLQGVWQELEQKHKQRRTLAEYLIQQAHQQQEAIQMTTSDAQTAHSPYAQAVQQRWVPEQQFATLTRRVYVNQLNNVIRQGLGQLHALAAAQATGPSIVIYHGEVNTDSDGPIEMCVPYTGLLTVPDGVTLRTEPAHQEAFVTLTKQQFEFPAILQAYDATAAYARAHGDSGPSACREVYHADWDASGENDSVGDVAWPFTPL
ncbi:MerR family transcriptional regulator [Deinococcus sp. QL22]|uniref:MerR family transcriptional regulator n=1 Tax=Deinococcus sp. QL22 TaxID=2939437 RepID=UPI002016D57F|nr:MerR family transcriptional regulator [Deinococcus sp. QL22]UQN09051.1 MerR family transcriptional regulator [Deinococcus sp. QL22]